MYLHIIKIKINIYIFYTSYGTATNGQSIPLSHLTELKSECSEYCHLYWNYGLYVHGKKKNPWEAIRLYFFFSFLQVALSLEDHSSEVQVVKHLLHSLSRPFPHLHPPHLIYRLGVLPCTKAPWTHMHANSQNTPGSVEGLPGTEDGPGAFWCYFLHGNPTAVEVTGFCAFPQRSSYVGRWEEGTEMNQGNRKWHSQLWEQQAIIFFFLPTDFHVYF